ncbi:sporulation protein YpjB, partial [Frankia sp. Cpl3]|nr:sporulation protein YpjB [Frankia sp. Cpl3]
INAAYELLSKELRNDPLEWQTIREALRELNSGMQAAFIGEDKSAMAGPPGSGSPLTLIFSIAAAVSMALAYVGWKKYSGEQAKTI